MGKKSSPPPPDYTAAAEAQAQQSKENLVAQTWANRADQTNPWGSLTWNAQADVDPATGQQITRWTQSTTLDPRLQQALDSQIDIQNQRSGIAQNLLGRVEGEFGAPMDWGSLNAWGQGPQQAGGLQATTNAFGFGPRQQFIDTSRQQAPDVNTGLQEAPQLDASRQQAPQLQTGLGDAGQIQRGLDYSGLQDVQGSAAQRQRAEDAIYQSATSRLDPQWQQRQQSMESDLANRGITRGSEAYSRAMADFERNRTDAYAQAQMAAITGGGAEAQRNYGMDIGLRQQQAAEQGQLGQFGNQAQQQAFQQGLMGGQFGNQAMGQQYGMDAQARAAQMAAQQAQFGMGQSALQQQLAAQQAGFGMGSQAREQQLAAQQLAYQQQLASGQYGLAQQQQAFGQQQQAGAQNFQQQMAYAQYQNQLRQQQLQEMMQQRGFSLNEMQALLNGQQVNMPQFGGYSQAGVAQGADLLGAAQAQWGATMDTQNAKNAAMGNLMQGAGGLASAFMMCDRRVKRDVRRVGRSSRGWGVYAFRYVGERATRLGVIAQDVRRVAPELVRSFNGVLHVDRAAFA